jgi:hypothetical protein
MYQDQQSAHSLVLAAIIYLFALCTIGCGQAPDALQNARRNQPFLIGNGVEPRQPYPCDVNFAEQLKNKQPWPLQYLDLVYYPHRVEGLDAVFENNLEFIATNLAPFAPGLIFAGATVQHGDVTFRPEVGPTNLGLAEPFNQYSIARQTALTRSNNLMPARHLSLAGMIAEQLPPNARELGFYSELKTNAIGPIRAGHTMVIPNYSNPAVLKYLEDTFDILTDQAGFRYYWMDNWMSADKETYPAVYQAVRAGSSRHQARVILRSGAGPSQVGLTDVMAPSPDIQHAWCDVVSLLDERIIEPYTQYCPNAFKIGFDDFYINQPYNRDQARFEASMYALPGIEMTITEGEFYKTPMDRVRILQKVLPLPVTGPLQPIAPSGSRIWVECVQRPFEKWWVAGFFNSDLFQPEDLELNLDQLDEPPGAVLAWDFWDERLAGVFKDKIRVRLAPSSCLVLALRRQQQVPQLLSTSRHILQGAEEISDCAWNPVSKTLAGTFTNGVEGNSFSLFAHLPAGWKLKTNGGGMVSQIKPEVLRLALPPQAGAIHWSLSFVQDGTPAPLTLTTTQTITNTLGEFVTGSTDLAGNWITNGSGVLGKAIIPADWQHKSVRIYFTTGGIQNVRLNGLECPRMENPAKKFTAWYQNKGERVFELPSNAIRWGQQNELQIFAEDKSWLVESNKAGFQLDIN